MSNIKSGRMLRGKRDEAMESGARVVAGRPARERDAMSTDDRERRVLDAIRQIDPHDTDGWHALERLVANPRFVAVDPVSHSIGIDSSGYFTGTANVLIKAPAQGFGGRVTESSYSIPVVINGRINAGHKPKIKDVLFRFGSSTPFRLGGGELSAPLPAE